ncbi:MAG: transglycosylase domain-containing protein [Flavobacteriaceae bacterium]|nr:transglycosylase domain-containing protein [Flavobacteriaceae bacterium]
MEKEVTKNETKKRSFKKYILWFWGVFLSGVLFVILLFLLASWGVFGKLPSFEELENPENNLATEIISSDGQVLGKYFKENRTPVSFEELPPNLIKALVATEDERFYEHSGIDFEATARAVVFLGKAGGGSTITQQLAKLLFHGEGSKNIVFRVMQKIKEYVIATRLERQYTKNEILTMYLNKYDFLFNAVGIRSAARIYFGKEPKDLDVQESAILVAMFKNPRQYNPHRKISKNKSLSRRNIVFSQMEKKGFITEKEKDSLQALPLKIKFTPEGHTQGMATYFREHLRSVMKEWIEKNPKSDGSKYNLYQDGLKIYVSIDSRMQKLAEEAMEKHMKNLQRAFLKEHKKNPTAPFYELEEKEIKTTMTQAMKRSNRWIKMKKQGFSEKEIIKSFHTKEEMSVFSWKGEIDTIMTPYDSIRYYKHFLRSGLLSIEPQTGHIKAWVGGIDYKNFKYDAVQQQKRQVGSTFKPFVYATAINQLNLSPCEKYPNTKYTIPKGKYGIPEDWSPKNSGDKYGGELTLKEALAKSVNVVTARLVDMVHPKNVVALAHRAGIQSDIPEMPSIALGTVDLSLLEMVGAYATFANKGLRIEPMFLLEIEDKNGTVLQRFSPKSSEVLSEESAYTILNLLQGVTQFGSGMRLRNGKAYYPDNVVTGHPYRFTNPIAGKTGTTQNQSDGWFIGVVPNLATGVWVGGEDRSVHFYGIGKGQGASMALPIWALYYKALYENKDLSISKSDFKKPENLSINLDCDKADEKEKEGKSVEVEEEAPEF